MKLSPRAYRIGFVIHDAMLQHTEYFASLLLQHGFSLQVAMSPVLVRRRITHSIEYAVFITIPKV
jgi:hypothetical protein